MSGTITEPIAASAVCSSSERERSAPALTSWRSRACARSAAARASRSASSSR